MSLQVTLSLLDVLLQLFICLVLSPHKLHHGLPHSVKSIFYSGGVQSYLRCLHNYRSYRSCWSCGPSGPCPPEAQVTLLHQGAPTWLSSSRGSLTRVSSSTGSSSIRGSSIRVPTARIVSSRDFYSTRVLVGKPPI